MRILKDSAIYVFAEFSSKAVPFLLLPYLTRKLGAEGYGELSYYLSIIAFLLVFIGLSQQAAVTRYYYFYGKRALNLLVTTGYFYSFCIFFIGVCTSIILKQKMLFYCSLVAFFQSLHTTQLSIRQCQKQAKLYATLQIITSILNLALTILVLELFEFNQVQNRIIVLGCVYAVVGLVAYAMCFNQLNMKFNFSLRQYKLAFQYILGFGLPLVLHVLSYTVKGQFDRVLIYNNFSKSELGVYSAGVQIASVLSVFIMAVNTATLPYFYQYMKEKKINVSIVKSYFWKSFILVPLPAVLFYIFPKDLIVFILGKGFEQAGYYVMLFLISYALIIPYLLLVNCLFYYGKNMQIAFCSVVSSVVYVVTLFLLKNHIELLPGASLIANILVLPLLYFLLKEVDI